MEAVQLKSQIPFSSIITSVAQSTQLNCGKCFFPHLYIWTFFYGTSRFWADFQYWHYWVVSLFMWILASFASPVPMTKFLFTNCPAGGALLSQIWDKIQPFVPGLIGRSHASFGNTSQCIFFFFLKSMCSFANSAKFSSQFRTLKGVLQTAKRI